MPVDVGAELWEAWATGRLCLQECGDCHALQHPPGPVCARCHRTGLSLRDIDGAGALVSWSTVYRAPAPEFADDIPYTIAIVSVSDQALVEARMDPAMAIDVLQVGMPVRLTIGEVAGRRLPVVTSA